MADLEKSEIWLQKAHKQNFLFYDQEKKPNLKFGYPYWKLIDGYFHLRITPACGTKAEMKTWVENNLKVDLQMGKLYVTSGEPIKNITDEK